MEVGKICPPLGPEAFFFRFHAHQTAVPITLSKMRPTTTPIATIPAVPKLFPSVDPDLSGALLLELLVVGAPGGTGERNGGDNFSGGEPGGGLSTGVGVELLGGADTGGGGGLLGGSPAGGFGECDGGLDTGGGGEFSGGLDSGGVGEFIGGCVDGGEGEF